MWRVRTTGPERNAVAWGWSGGPENAHQQRWAQSQASRDSSPRKNLEEGFIFPTLRRSHLVAPILAMAREHAEIWATMERIENTDFDAQDESKHEAYLTLTRGLLEQLERHNLKEEPVIYPGIAERLSPEDIAKVEVLMVEASLPEGWVCQGARRG